MPKEFKAVNLRNSPRLLKPLFSFFSNSRNSASILSICEIILFLMFFFVFVDLCVGIFIVLILNKEGYHIFPYAEEVLRLFLNTEIIFDLKELKKIHAKRGRCYGEIQFNLLDTASGMYDSYGYLSSILNENVYPIGSVNNCLCLLVGESKRIYIDIKPVPKILGIDIVDFLNNIIAYKKFGIF